MDITIINPNKYTVHVSEFYFNINEKHWVSVETIIAELNIDWYTF